MTIRDAINGMQEPFRSQAINNAKKEHSKWHESVMDVPVSKVSSGLFNAFSWAESKEGFQYWNQYFRTLKKMHL